MAGELELRNRIDEEYVWNHRNSSVDRLSDWKDRIEDTDRLLRGDYITTMIDNKAVTAKPMVMNLGDTMARDVARLVSEVQPAARVNPMGEKQSDKDDALVRASAADTIWEENEAELQNARWTMDLIVAGAAFSVTWADPEQSDYALIDRVDPRFCYPTIHNGRLIDLLVIQTMNRRQAEHVYGIEFPQLDGGRKWDNTVELWDYYSADECVNAVAGMVGGKPLVQGVSIVNRWNPDMGLIPAAMAQLPSPDGAFRGVLDQLGPSLEAKNRIAALLVEYTEQQVYAPFEAKGILNSDDLPGPQTVYQHDPNDPNSKIGRVPPAGSSPQIFALMQQLDHEQRGGINYPDSRQGDVRQSIASAAFVDSTQGGLTSMVTEAQTLLAAMRARLTQRAFRLEKKYLDMRKPLCRPVGKKTMYRPSTDIGEYDKVRIVYGAGAGIGKANADVRVLQHLGAQLISKETARDQIDYLSDPSSEEDKIEREQSRSAVMQKFLADPNTPLDVVIDVHVAQEQGMTLSEAIASVQAKVQKIAEQQRAQEAAAQAPAGGEQVPAAEEQLAMEKGQTQGAPGAQPGPGVTPAFAPPPFEQIVARG
jgi:hypothetical protein